LRDIPSSPFELASGTIIDWLGNPNGGFTDSSGNLYTTVATEWKIEPHMWMLV
jgi:hypothetical protein